MNEVSAVVEVVNSGLNANISFAALETSRLKVNLSAADIFCLQAEGNTTTLKDKC